MRRIPGIDLVVVNSDCDGLLRIARQSGATVVKRDPEFATDEISTSDYYRHIAQNCPGENILSATVTTPLIRDASYLEGIAAFQQMDTQRYDSVTSCLPVREFLYLDGKPLNYDPMAQVASQMLPDIVAINYGYSIINRMRMIETKNIVGAVPFFMKMGKIESVDIDTEEDFRIAELLYRSVHGDQDARFRAA